MVGKITKFDLFVLRDDLFAITQLHTLMNSLLTVSANSYQRGESSYHRQTETNSNN